MSNLVLSRRKKEGIIVGDGLVTITVVDIRGDRVRLGIQAPRDMRVDREEVYEARRRDALRRDGLVEPPEGP